MEYLIHDNYNRPFMVKVKDDVVSVFKEKSRNEYNKNSLFTWNPEKVFIGMSPLNRMTGFSGGHGQEFDGNSILLHISGMEYVWIGNKIISFIALNTITRFLSPVGNNDVPYPFAVDEDNNHYLFTEDVIIKEYNDRSDDPYDYYYDQRLITTDYCSCPPKKAEQVFDGIEDLYVGNKKRTFIYYPCAKKGYDWIRNDGQLYIQRGGIKEELTYEKYEELMIAVGKEFGFDELKSKTLQKRIW